MEKHRKTIASLNELKNLFFYFINDIISFSFTQVREKNVKLNSRLFLTIPEYTTSASPMRMTWFFEMFAYSFEFNGNNMYCECFVHRTSDQDNNIGIERTIFSILSFEQSCPLQDNYKL